MRNIPKTYNHPNALKDRLDGDKYEKKYLPIIEEKMKLKFERGNKKSMTINGEKRNFDVIDFIDKTNKVGIELKSRTNAYNTYPTTFITKHKIDVMRKLMKKKDYEIFLYFVFRDLKGCKIEKCYYYQLLKEEREGEYTEWGGTWRRGRRERKLHYYIPIKYLTDITEEWVEYQ